MKNEEDITPAEAFKNGAYAMQARIVALISMKDLELAAKILALEVPPYSEPEKW